jgi:hypothetical protein
MSSPQERGTGYGRDAPGQGGAHRASTAPREAAEYRQPSSQAEYEARERERERERLEGRQAVAGAITMLAATLMILSGLWGFFVGITGVLSGGFYARVPATYTFSLSPYWWGVVQAIIGGVVFAAGVCLILGMTWARVVGITLAVISAIANFLFLPHYPIWSIIVIALDVIIIWALTTSHIRRLALSRDRPLDNSGTAPRRTPAGRRSPGPLRVLTADGAPPQAGRRSAVVCVSGSGVSALHGVVLLPRASARGGRRHGLAELLLEHLARRYVEFTEPLPGGRHHRSSGDDHASDADQAAGADQACAYDHRRAVHVELACLVTIAAVHCILPGVVGDPDRSRGRALGVIRSG